MSATKICPQCGREESLEVRFCPVDGSALRLTGAAESDLVGQIVGDRYHVLRKLGEGGMGQVYLVEHVKMQRKSALKVMNPGMVKDADAISRFNREAANASRINHPNVASVYDFGETPDGLIFLAMEFVDGPALTKVIEEQGALAPARAADIIRQAADALAVAHDMGIVHRDLKPDNIMIARTRDGADLVKVVDFGIAKAQDSGAQKVTKTGMVVGTPEYMSPEQLAGDKLDGRSDIYSLGLVAFNMLTGTLPFPSDSMQETMIMRLTDKPKPLGAMKADVHWPADVQAVMDKVLERDASIRYQNATDFGRALVTAVDRMPATANGAAGTMVIGAAATPARVSSNAPTAAMPATRVASASEKVASVGAPSHGGAVTSKGKMPMIVVGVLVVALIGVGAVVGPGILKKGDSTKQSAVTTNDTKTQAPDTVGRISAAAPPAGGGTTAHAAAQGGPPTGSAPSAFAEQLRLLDIKTDVTHGADSTTAKAALQELAGLVPKLKSRTDSLHAVVIRGEVRIILNDKQMMCDDADFVIDNGNPRSSDSTFVKRAKALKRAC